MRTNWIIAAAMLLAVDLALATGVSTGTSPRNTTSSVSVTVPGIVGIDVESDVAFNFGSYPPPGPPSATCEDNVFPPTPFCSGSMRFDAQTSHTASLAGPAPQSGALWISVFCSKSGGAALSIRTSATEFSPAITGLPVSSMRHRRATAAGTNGAGVGRSSAFAFSTTLTSITGESGLGATFGWTRIDQAIDLLVPSGFTYPETSSASTTIAYEIAK